MDSRHGTGRRILAGWLMAPVALALLLSGCGGAGGGNVATGPDATATAASAGLGTGAFPTPQEETFQNCPPPGDGGDADLNLLKNRVDVGVWQPTTVVDILALAWPPGIGQKRRSAWSPEETTQIAQNEGRPVVVEGSMLMVRHEGPESPNCHDQSQRDFHMWLATSAGDSRAQSVVVEVAPRARAKHPNWQPDARILSFAGHHVRISGWLMMDQEHPDQVHKTRGTIWEVHPVMKIEVEQNGHWTDLDDGSLHLSPTGALPSRGGVSPNAIAPSGSSHSHRHRRPRHTRGQDNTTP